jgi:hypothetical protein
MTSASNLSVPPDCPCETFNLTVLEDEFRMATMGRVKRRRSDVNRLEYWSGRERRIEALGSFFRASILLSLPAER